MPVTMEEPTMESSDSTRHNTSVDDHAASAADTLPSETAKPFEESQARVFTHRGFPLVMERPENKPWNDPAWSDWTDWRRGAQRATVDAAHTHAALENVGNISYIDWLGTFETLINMASLSRTLHGGDYTQRSHSTVDDARTILNNAVVKHRHIHPASKALGEWDQQNEKNKWEVNDIEYEKAKKSLISDWKPERLYV